MPKIDSSEPSPERLAVAEEAERQLVNLVFSSVQEILRTEDEAVFLTWVQEAAPRVAPLIVAAVPERARSLALAYGRALWSSTPLPGNGFRPRPLPRPERNAPCPCGSGLKYKRCCAAQASDAPDFGPENLWEIVFGFLSEDQREAAVRSRQVPRHVLADFARTVLEDGEPEEALAVVLPLFDQPERLDERDREALEVLLDAYDELEWEEEKEALVSRLARELRRPLRQALWQHVTISHIDDGEMEKAWEAFRRAEREDPAQPGLGFVEVSLLLADDQLDKARECGRTWRSRLRGREDDASPELLRFFEETAADPGRAQLHLATGDHFAPVVRLIAWLDTAGEPAAYRVETAEGGGGRLVESERLADVEKRWEEILPGWADFAEKEEPELDAPAGEDDELSPRLSPSDEEALDREPWDDDPPGVDPWEKETVESWLAFLESEPAAIGSLKILAAVGSAIDALTEVNRRVVDRDLSGPLVRRGKEILDRALAGHSGAILPWRFAANRPALRLLALEARKLWEGSGDLAPMERLLALDPDDGFHARPVLLHLALLRGEDERVTELAAEAPDDDSVGIRFGAALALARLGRLDEATRALDRAVELQPATARALADLALDRDSEIEESDESAADGFDEEPADFTYVVEVSDLWREQPELLARLAARVEGG